MNEEIELSRTAVALLLVLDDIGKPTDTQLASRGLAVKLGDLDGGMQFQVAAGSWFGLRDLVDELERHGLVHLEVGMASPVLEGSSANPPDPPIVRLSATGRSRAAELKGL